MSYNYNYLDDKDSTRDKLYSWIESLIHVRCVETRTEFATIYDLIKNTLENGEDSINSKLSFDGNEYVFTISLTKNNESDCDCMSKGTLDARNLNTTEAKKVLIKALEGLNEISDKQDFKECDDLVEVEKYKTIINSAIKE